MITFDKLSYSPETGVIVWKSTGKRAGTIDKDGYLRIQYEGKKFNASHIAFFLLHGTLPSETIDHINGNVKDNRSINIREVPQGTNCKNKKTYSNNASGFRGVQWRRDRKRWVVTLGNSQIGVFKTLIDAVVHRITSERASEYHSNHGRITPI